VKNWSAVMQLVAVVVYVALCLLIPAGVGFWLGREMGHSVMFPLIGLAVGTLAMCYGVYRMVKPFLQEARDKGGEKQAHWPMRMFLGERRQNKVKE
jgi:hypothetical protein